MSRSSLRGLVAVLMLAALTGVGGCSYRFRPPAVQVANTPEAQACRRQCAQMALECANLCTLLHAQQCVDNCADQRDACLKSCPGGATPITPAPGS